MDTYLHEVFLRTFLYFIAALMSFGCGSSESLNLPMADMDGTAEPNLSVAADGTVTLSYLHTKDGSARLYFRELEARGWSTPRLIAQDQDQDQELLVNWADFPSLIKSGDEYTAHWLVKTPGGTYAYHVYTASSLDDGMSWSVPERLHDDNSATEHGFVSLYANHEGVGAFWLDGQRYASAAGVAEHGSHDAHAKMDPAVQNQDAQTGITGMQLRHKILSSRQPNVETVVDGLVCDCCQTDVAVVDGSPLVVYRNRSETNIRDISVARLENDIWVSTTVANDNWHITGCPVNGPAIDYADGVVAVAWFTASPAERVRMAFSLDGGRTFQPAIDVATTKPQGRVDIQLGMDGEAYVSWLSAAEGGLMYRRVGPDRSLGAAVNVAPMASHRKAGFPRMIAHEGRLIFAWTDSLGNGTAVRSSSVPVPVSG